MANDINDILGINLPKEEPGGKRKIIENLIQDLVFSIGQGYSAGGRGPQGRSAGIGAALQGPMVRQQMMQQQANDAQDRAIKIAQLRQAALKGDQDAVLRLREAMQGSVAPEVQVPAAPVMPSNVGGGGEGLQPQGTRQVPMPLPTLQYPTGGGQSIPLTTTSAQQAREMAMNQLREQEQIKDQYSTDEINVPGVGLFSRKQGKIIPGTETVKAPPQTTYGAGENVMVDGKAARIVKSNTGEAFYEGTKTPVTGRITPYITPPSPRQKGEITPTAEANLVTQLNRQWQTAAKDVQALYRANTIMDEGMKAAKAGNMNAGSQAVLVTFQKFLDPTSVVRESEYARSGAGLAMAQRIRGWYEKNFETGGAGVPLDELQRFADLAKEINSRLAAEGTSLLTAEKKRISSIADRYNIPAELVVTDYDFANRGAGATTSGTVRYTDGGRIYEIPAPQEKEFLKDHPKAVKP